MASEENVKIVWPKEDSVSVSLSLYYYLIDLNRRKGKAAKKCSPKEQRNEKCPV
jgi:hypothetical protein